MEAGRYPREIVNHQNSRVLGIVWDDGKEQQFPHALLRAQCKCTVCQSSRLLAGAQQATAAVIPEDVSIRDIRQIGAYGVQIVFSDGHERGIYPWPYLRTLVA